MGRADCPCCEAASGVTVRGASTMKGTKAVTAQFWVATGPRKLSCKPSSTKPGQSCGA